MESLENNMAESIRAFETRLQDMGFYNVRERFEKMLQTSKDNPRIIIQNLESAQAKHEMFVSNWAFKTPNNVYINIRIAKPMKSLSISLTVGNFTAMTIVDIVDKHGFIFLDGLNQPLLEAQISNLFVQLTESMRKDIVFLNKND